MSVVVGRNQTSIYGSVDGKKFPNIPLNIELFQKLNTLAKEANQEEKAKHISQYRDIVKKFQSLLGEQEVEAKVEVEKKTEVKVGTNSLSITVINGKPYLVNKARVKSRFYIPDNLYNRILSDQSKGIDTTPIFKLMVRALRGVKMTQSKLNNLDVYMNRKWLDKDKYQELLEKGYTEEKAKEEATFLQVPITQEGLIHTYKVSTIVSENGLNINEYRNSTEPEVSEDEEVKEDESEKPSFEEFVFKPIRNNKGHFYAKGSQEYMNEYNKQLREYNEKHQVIPTATITNKKTKSKVVVAVKEKSAEDYVFKPYYQGDGGDAFYCGEVLGHEIRVGFVHRLPEWSMVNTDDSTSGVKGLHVGGLEYIHDNIQGGISPTHNVFVDPQFIGAVCRSEDQYGAIRVKEYYVHSTFVAPNKGSHNSSTYAAMTDKEWDEQIAEAQRIVEEGKKAQEFLDSTFQA